MRNLNALGNIDHSCESSACRPSKEENFKKREEENEETRKEKSVLEGCREIKKQY